MAGAYLFAVEAMSSDAHSSERLVENEPRQIVTCILD